MGYAMKQHRRALNEMRREASVPHKVMLRMDRELARRGIRSYRGYETRGRNYARILFDNQTIEVTPFGQMRRVAR
jgi:hypothetical protein